uniref:XRE family transcriptional regulator n=1 Tax=Staphylococcus aureus TaxID=1280 RepID=D2J8D0_STAAU|nr:hypothetical protein [Staphylococcus aureus]ACZ59030.1 hypothetical protein SAP040A_048 [Staphylococcus aureus]
MVSTLERKTNLQKMNDRLRFKMMIFRKNHFEPPYTNLERRSGLPPHTLSHWVKGRDLNREKLEKIERLINKEF